MAQGDVKIIHAKVSCPTCKQPVVGESEVGISINEIASLGAQLVQLRTTKPSALTDLRIQEVLDRLRELGAHVDEEGWVRSGGVGDWA